MNYKNISQIKLSLLLICAILLSSSLAGIAQPRTSANVGGYESGSKIPKSTFGSLPGVGVYVKDAPFEIRYSVVEYTLKLADDEGGFKEVSCQGSTFSALAKKYINDYAKPGDIISIQNIKVKAESGVEMKLPALLYYIE